MGTVTKSIGTASRDYSTIQAWEDALPANLVTDGNAQVGECYNDAEFAIASGTTSAVVISGQTTDTTNNITLKCATGQSFRDNANVQTNDLKYNQTNGVAIRKTNNYVYVISATSNNINLHGLQIKHSGTTATTTTAVASGTNFKMEFCILEGAPADASTRFCGVDVRNTGAILRNNLIISTSANASGCINYNQSANTIVIVNNTLVRCSDKSASTSVCIRVNYGTSANGTIKNNAIFGWSAISTSGKDAVWGTASNNASDLAISFGTSNQASLTYTDQFAANGTVSTTQDWKPVSTGSLDENGVTDSTHGPIDIAGTSRPSGSAYDIGCWELVAAAVSIAAKLFNINQAVNRASTF